MIAPTPFFSNRGTHIRILEEALALERRGHELTIATYHIGENPAEHIDTQIDVRRILRLLFWYKKHEAGPDWQKIILNMMLLRKVFFLVRTQKPDVIHAHLHEGVLIGWIVQKLFFWRRLPLVADFHGSLVAEMVSHNYLRVGVMQKFFGFLERMINRMGDSALASSPENAQRIKKDRRGADVTIVEDGVGDYDPKTAPRATLLTKYHLPADKRIVVYTGALMPDKGVDLLCAAAARLCAARNDTHFLFGGFPREHIEKLLAAHNLTTHATIISPLRYFDLLDINALGAVGVDPKTGQTRQASGKILHYMAAGLSVVCMDRPTNRQYLGENGVYYAEPTAEALAAAIVAALDDPERAARSKQNLQRSRAFSWDKSAQTIEKCYTMLYSRET